MQIVRRIKRFWCFLKTWFLMGPVKGLHSNYIQRQVIKATLPAVLYIAATKQPVYLIVSLDEEETNNIKAVSINAFTEERIKETEEMGHIILKIEKQVKNERRNKS